MRLVGMGLTDIARNLNDHDIKYQTVYKYEKSEATNHGDGFETMCWTSNSVHQLLTNKIYTGAVVSLKSGVDLVSGKLKVKPNHHCSSNRTIILFRHLDNRFSCSH